MVLVKLSNVFAVVCALYASVGVAAATTDAAAPGNHHKRRTVVYSNHFAVHVPDGKEAVNSLADKHGFVNHGQVGYS